MSIFNKILGIGINPIADGIEKISSIFKTNSEKQAIRDHDNDVSVRAQYAAEFINYKNRSIFDSFVDGANRLVRPFMAFGVMAFFGIVIYDTQKGADITLALATVPEGMWILLSIIVSFFFGSRHVLKGKQFDLDKSNIEAIKQIQSKKNDEKFNSEMKSERPLSNAVIQEWNRRNKANK